jgi:hypothetical protein
MPTPRFGGLDHCERTAAKAAVVQMANIRRERKALERYERRVDYHARSMVSRHERQLCVPVPLRFRL